MILREFPVATTGRITLTAKQLAQPEIKEFVALLVDIAADGVLEYEELERLTSWLNDHSKSDTPAVQFLFKVMLHICSDARITPEDLFDLQMGIERVLPKAFRSEIAEHRKKAYYQEPASVRQLEVIGYFTKDIPPRLTRGQASEMITTLTEHPPASNRQIMFLRFWGRPELASMDRRQISAWMDGFIDADPRRMDAWSLFKMENGDDGSQRDPTWVPINVAAEYYRRA